MPYLPTLNDFLYQSSLLLQAYPSTRITTKYSLPRKRRPRRTPSAQSPQQQQHDSAIPDAPNVRINAKGHRAAAGATESTKESSATTREKLPPAATLTVKAYHPDSGICLKYRTDKAQEVGRLIGGLGRLARGDVVEEPNVSQLATAKDADPTPVDGRRDGLPKAENADGQVDRKLQQPQPAPAAAQQQQDQRGKQLGGAAGGGGAAKKKKKGKR